MTTFPDLSVPLREAIVSSAEITALLSSYKGSYPVFTRTPVPNDAPSVRITISQNLATAHEDGISDQRLVVTRDIVVSGENDRDWETVDRIARLVASLFHRRERNLTVNGWKVVRITATTRGGQPASELEPSVAMVVTLTILLASAN